VLKLRILSAGVGLNRLYWSFSLGPVQAAAMRRPAVSHVVAKSHVSRMSLLSQTLRYPAVLRPAMVASTGYQKRCAMPT
jgi:hypothetical protein